MTQEQLAEKAGLSPQWMQRIESRNKRPVAARGKTVKALAAALGVEVEEIVEFDEEMAG